MCSLLAVLAGIGFGLSFILFADSSHHPGFWPVLSARMAAVVGVWFVLLVTRSPKSLTAPSRGLAASAGLLDVTATALLIEAVRTGLTAWSLPLPLWPPASPSCTLGGTSMRTSPACRPWAWVSHWSASASSPSDRRDRDWSARSQWLSCGSVPSLLPLTSPIRMAVVGLGQIAELVIPAFTARADVEIVGLCDRNEDRVARWAREVPVPCRPPTSARCWTQSRTSSRSSCPRRPTPTWSAPSSTRGSMSRYRSHWRATWRVRTRCSPPHAVPEPNLACSRTTLFRAPRKAPRDRVLRRNRHGRRAPHEDRGHVPRGWEFRSRAIAGN